MAKFFLRPAHLRDDKFVAEVDEDLLELDWSDALERLAPSRSIRALNMLRLAKQGWFIGTRQKASGVTNFVFDAAGKAASIAEVLRRQPMFAEELREVFFVERVEWEASLQERV